MRRSLAAIFMVLLVLPILASADQTTIPHIYSRDELSSLSRDQLIEVALNYQDRLITLQNSASDHKPNMSHTYIAVAAAGIWLLPQQLSSHIGT